MRLLTLALFLLTAGLTLAQPYAAQSVLRTGTWVQLAVSEPGLYRLDAAQLQSLGLNLSTLDPRTLRLYGNAQGLQPQRVGHPRIDDLRENAIVVTGEADGRFDPADVLYFYAEGPHRWRQRPDGSFYHELHYATDAAYYFLTFGQGNGLRVATLTPPAGPTETLTAGPAHAFIEADRENFLQSGRQWFGDRFETTTTFSYPIATGVSVGNGSARVRVAARSGSSSSFAVSADATPLGSVFVPGVPVGSSDADFAAQSAQSFTVPATAFADGQVLIRLDYARPTGAIGWLDWIELFWTETWASAGNAYFFQSPATGTENVATLRLATPLTDYTVWDVSDPTRPAQQPYALDGSGLSFTARRDTLRRYLAWRPAAARAPQLIGAIPTQNLHALGPIDYVIVTPEAWRAQAERLADFHRSQFARRVAVVSPEQCYREFSSGLPDPTAIRDFIAMLWARAGSAADRPQYLLLFGDGSYDTRNRLGLGTDFVPSYQSRQSLSRTATYTSDDYFGFVEPGEGFYGEGTGVYEGDVLIDIHTLDVAVGRLPVRTLEQARTVVDKVIAYATQPASGDWRRLISFVGDYRQGEGALHTSQADSLARMTNRLNPCARVEKIYLDQFPASTAGGGLTFPGARSTLLEDLQAGSLIVNYTGHGGESVLSNSRVVQLADVEALRNGNRLPFWITATCEFGRWDDPAQTSGAEQLLVNPLGGAIGLLTSVRLVFSFPNFVFNRNWYDEVFATDPSGQWGTLGDLVRRTKNATWPSAPINTRNFSLLADPGIRLAQPTVQAVITELDSQALTSSDTLRALQAVTLSGEIRTPAGALVSSFAGQIRVTLFDKALAQRTLLGNMDYTDFRTVLFNGIATVANGRFQISFVLPLDINYSFGPANLQLYAEGIGQDAMGCWRSLTVGGTDLSAGADLSPPSAELYLDDFQWRSGGLTGPDPLLLARLADDRGINSAGVGVGRELLAILDGDEQNALILNDAYVAKPDNAAAGTLSRRLSGLADGPHTLTLRVWDVSNNPAEVSTQFVVAAAKTFTLSELLVYPNPLAAGQPLSAEFRHNRSGRPLQLTLELISPEGRPVRSLTTELTSEGLASLPTPLLGAPLDLAPGLYLVRLTATDPADGQTQSQVQRLLILR